MYLYEVLKQKRNIETKLRELQQLLNTSPTDDLAKEFMDLSELRQSKLISINVANAQSEVLLGNSKINVSIAIIIRDTLLAKINMLSEMITSDNDLDKLNLMKQREKYFEDYLMIDVLVNRNDLSVTLE